MTRRPVRNGFVGETCQRSALYECFFCAREAVVMRGEPFPQCPENDLGKMWVWVRDAPANPDARIRP